MKAHFLFCILLFAAATSFAADSADSSVIEKLNERVTELEAGSILQRFHLGGVLINRFEYFQTQYGPPGTTMSQDVLKPFITYFALNTNFDVSKRIKVYSTLSMSKFWNNDGRNEAPDSTWQAAETGSYGLRGSIPMFDAAYMAYNFDFPLTFAIGRMPTNDGPPINQLDGLPRQGTYPRFAMNAIFDGLALVYDFSHLLPEGNTLKLRAFYTPTIFIDKSDRTRQLVDVIKVDSNSPQYVLLTEYSFANLGSFMDRINLSYMFYQYFDAYCDGQNPVDAQGDPPNNPLDSASAHMVYLGFEGIGKVGLNVSASILYYADTVFPLDRSWTENTFSTSVLFNVNKSLDFLLKGSLIGFEYINTDPAFYLDEWTALELVPFYYTAASHGWHLYASAPLVDKLRLRVGWYTLHSDPYFTEDGYSNNVADSYAIYTQLRLDF